MDCRDAIDKKKVKRQWIIISSKKNAELSPREKVKKMTNFSGQIAYKIKGTGFSSEYDRIIAASTKAALGKARAQAVINGTSNMTMDEIDAEIQAYRDEKKLHDS